MRDAGVLRLPLAIAVLMVFLATAVVGCGGSDETATPTSPAWAASLAAAKQQAANDGKRIVLVFTMEGSPAVEVLFDETLPSRDVRGQYDKFVWAKADIIADKELSQQFRISVAPSIVVLEPSGEEVARHEKFMDGPEMDSFLSRHLGR
jgi:hypothetical protein